MGVIVNVVLGALSFTGISSLYNEYVSLWEFEPYTGFMSVPVVSSALACYCGMLYYGPKIMNRFPSLECKRILIKHNEFLAAGSLYVLCGVLKNAFSIYLEGGFEALFCDKLAIQKEYNELFFLYYIFHLSKFYEFFDTFFLIVAKKKVILLHWWHHITTLLLTTATMNEYVPGSWYVIAANTFVHVVMYTYYALAASGQRVWWKRYITRIQIGQFVTEIVFLFPVCMGYKYIYYPDCYGSLRYAIFAFGILGSFLILFLRFYIRSYMKN